MCKINKSIEQTLTIRAWFSGLTFSKKTLRCNFCCSTWGFLDKTLRISATIFCTKKHVNQKNAHQKVLEHFLSMWTNNAHINFVNIQVTDSNVTLDTPMRFLAQISHNIYCKLVVRNMNCLTIITSDDGWWPPAYMLEKKQNLNTT